MSTGIAFLLERSRNKTKSASSARQAERPNSQTLMLLLGRKDPGIEGRVYQASGLLPSPSTPGMQGRRPRQSGLDPLPGQGWPRNYVLLHHR